MSVSRFRLIALTAVLVCAWSTGADASETAIGVTSGTAPELVRFDTASPGTLTARSPLTGLLAGESVAGLDMRPASGELWAFTSTGRMLLVEPNSGETRQVGAPLDTALISPVQLVGIDFNPTVDRLRLVSTAEDNLRVNPLTFLPVDSDADPSNGTQPDTDLAFKAPDPNSGQTLRSSPRPTPTTTTTQARRRRSGGSTARGTSSSARAPSTATPRMSRAARAPTAGC